MPRLLVFIILVFVLKNLNAQQHIKGSWYGRADVQTPGATSNYLTEFILKQKGNDVEGIFAYYLKDSYQSFFVRGTYDPKTRMVSIMNIPLLFHGSPARTGIECPMNFEGRLMVSKVGNFINGNFYTEPKYKYTCPQLRVSMKMDESENQDSALTNAVAGRKFWQPQEEDVVIASAAAVPAVQVAVKQENPNQALIDEFSKSR